MAFVYWIHLPEHTDITSQGYIGITSTSVSQRFGEHLRSAKSPTKRKYVVHNALLKYHNKVCVSTLIEGSLDYCLLMEERLRPTKNLGWNIGVGGGSTQAGAKRTEEERNKMSAAKKAKPTLLKMWEHSGASAAWVHCREMYSDFLENKPAYQMKSKFNVGHTVAYKMRTRFRNGWNPNEDQEYLSWLEEKKGKQCHMN